MSLKGKCALITGSARGIGRATAITLAGYGADIALNDIAEVIAFLISDKADYITGQVIHVNGGWYM